MTTRLDFAEYTKNKDALARIGEEIERLEGFEEPTRAQEQKLDSLRSSFRVLDEARKTHERRCLVDGISFDGKRQTDRTPGHAGKDLDDY